MQVFFLYWTPCPCWLEGTEPGYVLSQAVNSPANAMLAAHAIPFCQGYAHLTLFTNLKQ